MASVLVCLLVLLGVGYRVTTAEDRARLARTGLAMLRQLKADADRRRAEPDAFRDALRERTPLALATPALVALNVTIFVLMVFETGPIGDPDTLIRWGGSVGPHTANGEWWRLVTATFVHTGFLHLVASIGGLAQVGRMLERLVGSLAFVVIYLSAGTLAGLASVTASPLDLWVGATGSILGVYGLLLASLASGLYYRSPMTIPLKTLGRLAPGAVLFLLYTLATGGFSNPTSSVGFVSGLVSGLALTRRIGHGKPLARQTAITMAAAATLAVAFAVPLRGVRDIRPELERVKALEDRTALTYQSAVERFRKNQLHVDALVGLIDDTIVPELAAAHRRILQLDGVPEEDRPVLTSADEYFRQRKTSWQLRLEGLRETDMRKLGEADRAQQIALEALRRSQPTIAE